MIRNRDRDHRPSPMAWLAPLHATACRAGLRARGRASTGSRLWAQAALAWLLLALVVVPTLGRLHQVMHAPALQAHALSAPGALSFAAPGLAAGAIAGQGSAPAHAHGLIDTLLAHHAPVDCLLLDQLALGDALHSAPVALTAAVPAQAPPGQPGATAAARPVAFFQARGPPGPG